MKSGQAFLIAFISVTLISIAIALVSKATWAAACTQMYNVAYTLTFLHA